MVNLARPNFRTACCCLSLLLLSVAIAPTCGAAEPAPACDNPTWESSSLSLDGKTNLLVLPDFHLKTQPQCGYAIDAGEARTSDANNFRNSRWVFSSQVTFTLPTGNIVADSAIVTFVNNQISAIHVTGSPATFEHRNVTKQLVAHGSAGVIDYQLTQNIVKLSEQAWVSVGQNECRAVVMLYNLSNEQLSADSADQNGQKVKCTVKTGNTTTEPPLEIDTTP